MSTPNIEKFNEIVGSAFADLYISFPVPLNLLAETYIGESNVIEKNGFTGAELTKDAEFFIASIEWLIDAEYIKAKDRYDRGFRGAVLTAKGLESMKSTPDSLTQPLGARLVDASRTEGRELLRHLVNEVLSIGLKLITNT